MSDRVFLISLRAQFEIERAARWWRRHHHKAPNAFRESLERAFTIIQRRPAIGTPQISGRLTGLRRYPIRRIRYTVWYILRDDVIEILVVKHGVRRPPRL